MNLFWHHVGHNLWYCILDSVIFRRLSLIIRSNVLTVSLSPPPSLSKCNLLLEILWNRKIYLDIQASNSCRVQSFSDKLRRKSVPIQCAVCSLSRDWSSSESDDSRKEAVSSGMDARIPRIFVHGWRHLSPGYVWMRGRRARSDRRNSRKRKRSVVLQRRGGLRPLSALSQICQRVGPYLYSLY